jgi:hypothetical protein
MEGAIAVAERCPDELADGPWNAIIDFAIEQPQAHLIAIRVITHLTDTRAACLPELLGKMQDATDSKVSEVAMIGLLNSSAPEARAHAAVFRNHPDRAVRSLALLVEARGEGQPTARELEELSEIAAGAGRVTPNMRAIAAWLWLRHTNQQERAVARIVGEA